MKNRIQRTTVVRFAIGVLMLLSVAGSNGSCSGQDTERAPRVIVGTRNIPPFAVKSGDGSWSGLSLGLWEFIAAELNVDFEIREYADVSSLLQAVENSEIDICIAALTVTAEREKRVDFTMPFYTSGIGVAIRKGDQSSILPLLGKIFTYEIFAMAAAMTIVVAIVGILAWLLERKRNSEHFNRKTVRGIWDGFWFAAVTMTTVGYGDKSPKSVPGRLLALVWMLIGIVMISLFTAAAASTLTQAQMQSHIQRSSDLLNYRCGTNADSTSGRFLTQQNIGFRDYTNIETAVQALVDHEIDACVYDAPTLRYLAHQTFDDSITVLPVRFQRASYAFAMPQASPLREAVNQSLLQAVESDEWSDRLRRLLGR